MARILRVQCVPVRAADRVVVATAILAIVGRVLFAPCLGVETAVCSLRDVVLAKQVGVEKLASVVSAIAAWMSAVVGGVGLAGTGAQSSIVHAREVLLTNVVARCIDGATERRRAIEAGLGTRRVVLGVTVGARDHHLEISPVLSLVLGCFRGDTGAPERALDVGESRRVWASVGWSKGRVTLEVDVEGSAKAGSIAQLLTLDRIIRLERVQAHVGICIHRSLEVDERSGVALRRSSTVGGVLGRTSVSDYCPAWNSLVDIHGRSGMPRKHPQNQWLALGHIHLAVGSKDR